ncbi:hypothetical protein [Chryseobacterium sp. M5A1_1a]
MATISNYHISTKGNFKKVDFNVFKLLQAYLQYRRLKNKPDYLEVDGRFFSVQHESQSKNSFFQSRSNSFYFQEKGKKSIIRISDHWSESDFSKSKKFNCSYIRTCYWTALGLDKFTFSLPGEKYSSELIAGTISLSSLKNI